MGWALVYSCASPVWVNERPVPAVNVWVLLIVCPCVSVTMLIPADAVIFGKIGVTWATVPPMTSPKHFWNDNIVGLVTSTVVPAPSVT